MTIPNKTVEDENTPDKFYGGKTRKEFVAEVMSIGEKMREAEALIFKGNCNDFLIQFVEWEYWSDFAKTTNEANALMIQDMLVKMGKTVRITKFKTLSQFGEVKEPAKV